MSIEIYAPKREFTINAPKRVTGALINLYSEENWVDATDDNMVDANSEQLIFNRIYESTPLILYSQARNFVIISPEQ